MGSENTQEFRDNSLLCFDDDSSDYDGIKTSEESFIEDDTIIKDDFQDSIPKNKIENENNINNEISPNKVPVTFEWDQGGNSVYVTGSFCNWSQFFLMKKNSDGIYSYTLYLQKALIQYKFKVDDEWRCNEKFPIMIDNGNKNNYIDTTNWEISIENSDENTNTNANTITTTNSNPELSVKHKNNKSFTIHSNYSNYIPKKEEMNDFASKIPEAYKPKINLSIINENNSNLSNEEENLFGENCSHKIIKNIRHEQINHLNHKVKTLNQNNINNNPIINSIICRYRLKFTNFVYYK